MLPKKRKLSALDQIMMENEQKKRKEEEASSSAAVSATTSLDKPDYWLHENIVVKVVNKELGGGAYYKKKGVVEKVLDRYGAQVRMQGSETVLKIDQNELETVIPAIGRKVLIVNGRYRGEKAYLEELRTVDFCATLKLRRGPDKGKILEGIEFEDFCKEAE